MIVRRAALSRRTVLRGLGTTLALPFLEAMMPSARAADIAQRGSLAATEQAVSAALELAAAGVAEAAGFDLGA